MRPMATRALINRSKSLLHDDGLLEPGKEHLRIATPEFHGDVSHVANAVHELGIVGRIPLSDFDNFKGQLNFKTALVQPRLEEFAIGVVTRFRWRRCFAEQEGALLLEHFPCILPLILHRIRCRQLRERSEIPFLRSACLPLLSRLARLLA